MTAHVVTTISRESVALALVIAIIGLVVAGLWLSFTDWLAGVNDRRQRLIDEALDQRAADFDRSGTGAEWADICANGWAS